MKKSDNTSSSQIGPASAQDMPHAKKWGQKNNHVNQQRPLTSKSKQYHPEMQEELNRYRPATAPALNLSHQSQSEKSNHVTGDTATNDGTPFKRDAISERAHALLNRMKPKYFPSESICQPEEECGVIDIQPTSNIVTKFKKTMLLTPEERVEKRKIDIEFAKYYEAHRIPTRDIDAD